MATMRTVVVVSSMVKLSTVSEAAEALGRVEMELLEINLQEIELKSSLSGKI